MGYGDGIARKTGDEAKFKADLFLNENGFKSVGINRIVSLTDNPDKKAKIQVIGRCQRENP